MIKWKHVWRNFYKFIKNENLKDLASISAQPPESIFCRSTFGSDYIFVFSWVCLYQLSTSGFWDFLPFFLVDLFKLRQVGWGESVNSNLQVFPHILNGIQVGLWLGHSRTLTFLFWSHSSVALAECLGSLSCLNVNLRCSLRSSALWSRFSSRICLYLVPLVVPSLSLQVSQSLPLKSIPRAWCCHHHVSQ